MRRKSHRPYLFLFAALLLVMSVPYPSAESFRGTTMAALAPILEYLAASQNVLQNAEPNSTEKPEQMHRLQLENRLLAAEVARLRELHLQDQRLSAQLKNLQSQSSQFTELAPLVQKHVWQKKNLLKYQLQGVLARVIYRSPSSWGSSLWLNVGTANNEALGYEAIAKNSPVVIGDSIVGLVDFVGSHQCRVRLITDSGLTPSVRAVRKNENNGEQMYLAKGELHGSSQPLWRSRGSLLTGVGFNYDFPDDEGPARELASGIPSGSSDADQAIPLLKVNDLLVTTGMDGVFPPGFSVAIVTYVKPLQEGDYFYDLLAKPTASNLNELTFVHVIPPVGYDPDEQPPLLGE